MAETQELLYEGGGYLEKHPTWHSEDSSWKAGKIKEIIFRNNLSPDSFLEIGCGAGQILQSLKVVYPQAQFTGLEISPQAFEIATANNHSNLTFINGSFDALMADNHFNMVMMIDVFEHVEDYYGMLRQTRQYGDHFIFHIPLDLSVQTVLRTKPLSRKRKNLGHIHFFNRITALESLQQSGYTIVDSFYTASYTDLKQKSLRSRIWKYPRKILFSLFPEFTVRTLGGYSLMVLAK